METEEPRFASKEIEKVKEKVKSGKIGKYRKKDAGSRAPGY